MPKILNFVKKIHYYSELFTSLLNGYTGKTNTGIPTLRDQLQFRIRKVARRMPRHTEERTHPAKASIASASTTASTCASPSEVAFESGRGERPGGAACANLEAADRRRRRLSAELQNVGETSGKLGEALTL